MKKVQFIFILLLTNTLYSQVYTIRGKISDSTNSVPIANVVVKFDNGRQIAISDSMGFYSTKISIGEHSIDMIRLGYLPFRYKIDVKNNIELNAKLISIYNQLEEVSINGVKESKTQSLAIGYENISMQGLRKMPAILGEVDIFKSLQSLPGVTSIGEGANGVNIRGGGVDQNLILVDDMPIFNPTHVFGLFSILPTEAVRNIELYKGSIPARFGGKVSSVIDIKMSEPNLEKTKISGGIGPISNRFQIETPILKNKIGFLTSGRLSYNDFWFRLFKNNQTNDIRANFSDLASKIFWKINSKLVLSISHYLSSDFYTANDVFPIENIIANQAKFRYGHNNLSLRLNFYHSTKLNFKFFALQSQYSTRINSKGESYKEFIFENQVYNQILTYESNLNTNIDYKKAGVLIDYTPNPNHTFSFGGDYVVYSIVPGSLLSIYNKLPTEKILLTERANELAFHLTDTWTLSNKLSMNLGLRYVSYRNMGPQRRRIYLSNDPISEGSVVSIEEIAKGEKESQFEGFEPRLGLKYDINSQSVIKFAYNRTHQFLQLLSNNTTPLPTARWKTSNTYIKPLQSDFWSLGFVREDKMKIYDFVAELYFRQVYNTIDFISGANLQLNPWPETQILQGMSKSFGAELQIIKRKGETTGWLSYTYSRALRKISNNQFQIQNINNGDWYPEDFDKPHVFNAVINNQIGKHHNFSFIFTYNTGRPYTSPTGVYEIDGTKIPIYYSRNNSRISDYHRLDFSWTITNPSLQKKRWTGSWVFTIYNLYNRRNAFSYFFVPKSYGLEAYKLSVFSSAFLSLNYNFTFQ